jgi:hypothetical protein
MLRFRMMACLPALMIDDDGILLLPGKMIEDAILVLPGEMIEEDGILELPD